VSGSYQIICAFAGCCGKFSGYWTNRVMAVIPVTVGILSAAISVIHPAVGTIAN